MKQNEKFKTVLDIAIAGGFVLKDHKHFTEVDNLTGNIAAYESIIYAHDFAKALFGIGSHFLVTEGNEVGDTWNECRYCEAHNPCSLYCWRDLLIRTVLSDYPINFLYQLITRVKKRDESNKVSTNSRCRQLEKST